MSNRLVSPIKSVSSDFSSIKTDMLSDDGLKGKPVWFIDLIAGIGDMLNGRIDAAFNLALLKTAFTRPVVEDHLSGLDYSLRPQKTSTGTQRFTIDPALEGSLPVNISAQELSAITQGTAAKGTLRFEAREDVAITSFPYEGFIVDTVTDELLLLTKEYHTGDMVRLYTVGTLPSPLTEDTNYYIIKTDDDKIKLATSEANAYNGTVLDITWFGSGVHVIVNWTIKVPVYQQSSASQVEIGTSDGSSLWQSFDLPDISILKETIKIVVDGDYTAVETFVDSLSTDKHYRIYYKSDNSAYILFGGSSGGSDQFGKIPAAMPVLASWAVGGGIESNVYGVNKVNIYVGGNVNILSTANITDMEGGENPENIETAKILGPQLLKAQNLFFFVDQGITLSLAFSSNIYFVWINRNEYGPFSAQVFIIPLNGGLPSSTLKSDLQTYLISRTMFQSGDIRVEDQTYLTVDVTSQISVAADHVYATVKKYYDLALLIYFSETQSQIISLKTVSIQQAVDFINLRWSLSFVASDYDTIKSIIDAIEIIGYTDPGTSIDETRFTAFLIGNVPGLYSVNITAPTFPITLTKYQMTTDGIMTTTEL